MLFILADDFGINDISFNAAQFYETPNIDRLMKAGTVFTNGYAAAPVCSPSRASIMTGKSVIAHGVTDWIGAKVGQDWGKNHPHTRLAPPEYVHSLDANELSIAELFQENGYATFFAGKWHLGTKGSWPTDHGFQINKGGWDSGNPRGGYFSPYKNPNLEDGPDGENLSMRLANETAGFIRDHQETPFFAFLSFYAVHGPIQTTEAYWKKYRDKAETNGIEMSGFEMERRLPIRKLQDNPVYAGLVQQMDDAIGRVLDELDRFNLFDNTIIVFTSDNGGVASGDAFSTSNLPFRGGKGYQWEGGIRVPYVIKINQEVTPVKEASYPVSGQDFLPTLAELCDILLPTNLVIDGISLAPLWNSEILKERTLFWHYPHYGNQGGDPASIVRKGDMKLVYYWETQTTELYNLEVDLGEKNDLSTELPKINAELKNLLLKHLKGMQAQFPEENQFFDTLKRAEYQTYVNQQLLPNLEEQRQKMLDPDYQPNTDWWGSQPIQNNQ
ncbi:MAG: sulfatase [Bacteroidota bacterium]